jgi:hypothetical protein
MQLPGFRASWRRLAHPPRSSPPVADLPLHMPRAHYAAVPRPEGKRLADLFGISEDLLACRDYIQLYKSLCQTERSRLNH